MKEKKKRETERVKKKTEIRNLSSLGTDLIFFSRFFSYSL